MNFSGERYIPDLDAADISYEHWHRYLFASALVADKIVLDIASGEGYGTSLLAQKARHVMGVDNSLEALIHAAHKYKAANVEFRQGSVDSIPIPGREVLDVVVSFETIEHVGETEQSSFAKEVKRLLKPGGLLVISTPDKAVYTDKPGYHNQFHKKEFYGNEFLDFLRGYFRTVCLFSQRVYPVSYIWPLAGGRNVATEYQLAYRDGQFSPVIDNLKEGMYLVALCTDGNTAELGPSVLVDPWDRKSQINCQQIGAQRSSIESLSAQLQKQASAMNSMVTELTEHQTALRDAEAKLSEETARAAELAAKLGVVEREREMIRQELAIQDAALREQAAFACGVQERIDKLLAKLAARDSDLLAAIRDIQQAAPAGQAAAASTSSNGARTRKAADRQEYKELVQRVRRLVTQVVPANATIAVVNKGDPELLKLEGRQGWHFPQHYDGQYAGHYPEDSKAAIRELERIRARGAQFLLIPFTALWWLDHYKDFAAHLTDRYAILAREDQTCILYRLDDSAGQQVRNYGNQREYDSIAGQLRAVVDNILPADSTVLVVSKGDPTFVDLGKRTAFHFPQGVDGSPGDLPADSAAAIAELERQRERGAQFLVMPKTSLWWFDHYRDFGHYLETNYRAVVRQKHVCHIFDLKGR